MCTIFGFFLLASITQARARDVVSNHSFDSEGKMAENLADQARNFRGRLVDNMADAVFVDKLFKRLEDPVIRPGRGLRVAREGDAWRGHHADLEKTVLGKKGQLATPFIGSFNPILPGRARSQLISGTKRTTLPALRAQQSAGMGQVANLLLQKRLIPCSGEVNGVMSELITAQLLYLDSLSQKDILMLINSPGGSVTEGMAMFDVMNLVRSHVSTNCAGLAASMGAFLLAAGQQGKRYSFPNSRIMIHQPLGGAQGSAIDIEIQAREIMYHKASLNRHLAEFTGQRVEKIEKDTDRDNFMSPNEAVEYGLIDSVVSKPVEPK